MNVTDQEKRRLNAIISQLRIERYPFWTLWRELADYFLPKRYVWLQSDRERRVRNAKNPFILDSTGTKAARVLASGMMNGITSPSRPWFKLRIPGFDDEGGPFTQWADEVARRMMKVMGESNFYNSLAVLYLDLSVFGSAANLIYEDDETVIRCFNPALGEFYLGQDHRLGVNMFAREFCQNACQIVEWFGEENCSDQVRTAYKSTSGQQLASYELVHLIEPNKNAAVALKFKFMETYWEKGATGNRVLAQRGMNELPGIFPRWELTANDSYGTSPGMDALPDVIQLQLETKRKAQGLDKMINPPIVADIQLQHRPTALMPNGITYVAGANSIGVKPMYEIHPPIQEMTQDIRDVQVRIRETFFNELFQMISQLETVRSATEIDARREEKLVLLGSVLERFENEALDPAINRIYSIMQRRNMLPPAPEGIEDQTIEIQYVSILATAQQALAAAPTERWLALIGNIAPLVQDVLKIPNWDEVVRTYGLDIGVQAKLMRPREEVQEQQAQEAEAAAMAEAANVASGTVQAGKLLSETDVGGGANALQQLLASQ
jgi:head-to-tail connecting protein